MGLERSITAMFTIEIGVLEPGLHTFTLEANPQALDLDSKKFMSIEVDARLDVSERRILVCLTARAAARLECDRTLRPFDQLIEGTYHLLFTLPDFMKPEGDTYDEVRPMESTDTEIDVTDAVRDTILLAVPARCVAPGAEDEEIPTEFGAPEEEHAVDPRWAALRGLKSGANPN